MGQFTVSTSNDPLRAALDAMPHKVWIVKVDGPAIYYNLAMRAFSGSALELPDRPSRERALLHPDDISRFIDVRTAAVAAERDWALEARLRCPDGTFRWHQLNFSLLQIAGDRPAYLATATDVDDLHRALAIAQENEEQLRLAAEAAQLGMYLIDYQRLEQTWSTELKKIFGFTEDEPPPARIVDLIHPDDREGFERAREASLDPSGEGKFEDEHRILRRDGSIGWVYVKGRISFSDDCARRQPRRGIGLVLDITKRKHAELAVTRSEARYRTLFEQANDIVITLQLDGRIESINPAAIDILGYSPEELIGKTIYEFVPEELMPMQTEMLQRKLDGAPSTQYDLEVQTKDKRRRTLGVNSRLVLDEFDKPAFIHSIARDVTERREAERRQDLLVRELQHRTKNLLAVIQSIAAQTLQKGPQLSVFIGRLHALAHAQGFIAAGPHGGVPINKLVESGLSAFEARVKISGEKLYINGGFAQNLALLVHELATNAAKYGAFSSSDGWAAVHWETTDGNCPQFRFHWRENAGPTVREPDRKGFGTLLMSMFANSSISYPPAGLSYQFSANLSEVLSIDVPA